MSFSDFRLAGLVAMGAVVGSLGCGDSLGLPPPNFANVVDTTTLFALQGTPISSPSGYDMVSLSTSRLSTSRTDLGQLFDLAFDIDQMGRALIYPASALGVQNEAALRVSSDEFDRIDRAPTEGYQADSAIVARADLVFLFLARSRAEATFCGFLGRIPRFGKFHVLAVDSDARSVTMELLVNVNCGYRALTTGLPAN
jgi:hypothetical protein